MGREKPLSKKLQEITTEPKQKYIFYKLGLLDSKDEWQVLSDRYFNGCTREKLEKGYNQDVNYQKALKLAISTLHQAKLLELYDIYFQKAKEDTNSFKAFVDFSSSLFEKDDESELLSILNGVEVVVDDE